MKVLFLESFFGGSHKDFATGFKEHSAHDVDLITLPARFWKWRMRGAAAYFVSQIDDIASYDAVFATDMIDLTDFMALAGSRMPPVLLYFHENQLDYPLSPGEKRDFHLGFTNIISALAADGVMFNSDYHYSSFIKSCRNLLKKMPDYVPAGILDRICEKSEVAYPGCRFETGPVDFDSNQAGPPLIVWNHRWEHDKGPDTFFDILAALKADGVAFRLAVLGENFSTHPKAFELIKEQFASELEVCGYAASRKAYLAWLKKGDVVISCARQENFGISVVEAMRFGCLPVLPKRLSYPELIPEKYHPHFLYETLAQCIDKLMVLLEKRPENIAYKKEISGEMERFSWGARVKQYDNMLKKLK